MSKEKCLLVIGSPRINYYKLFHGYTVDDKEIKVEQAPWDDISICSYGQGGLLVKIKPSARPIPGTSQNKYRSVIVDFVLFRGATQGGPRVDWRYKLSCFAHSNIPSINSLKSFYMSQDKGVLYGRLRSVRRKMGGFKQFPLISQTCYSDLSAATFLPDFPCVAKVGTASGGLGKMRLTKESPKDGTDNPNQTKWLDFCSVCAMQTQFFTSEPYIEWKYDVRVQKIGNHYRAFKRQSKHWKSNTDIFMKDEDTVVEDRWKLWIDEVSYVCGMDICALDIIQAKSDEKEYILEINASSIGLNKRHQKEDSEHIRDLVLRKMKAYFIQEKKKEK